MNRARKKKVQRQKRQRLSDKEFAARVATSLARGYWDPDLKLSELDQMRPEDVVHAEARLVSLCPQLVHYKEVSRTSWANRDVSLNSSLVPRDGGDNR